MILKIITWYLGPKRLKDEKPRFPPIQVSSIFQSQLHPIPKLFLFSSYWSSCLFGSCSSGKTTLSASGMLLPDNLYDAEVAKRLCSYNDRCPVLVVTVASIVDPFLSLQHRENIAQVEAFIIDINDWLIFILRSVFNAFDSAFVLRRASPSWFLVFRLILW